MNNVSAQPVVFRFQFIIFIHSWFVVLFLLPKFSNCQFTLLVIIYHNVSWFHTFLIFKQLFCMNRLRCYKTINQTQDARTMSQ